jgi:soluble lytic murein transglycosylase
MRRKIIAAGICLFMAALTVWWLYHRTSRYDYIISQAAARNGVDFYLVKALIYEESWFRSQTRGPAGELGLMQITKAAGMDFSILKGFLPLSDEQIIEPELNIEIGCWYLKRSLEHYKNSPNPTLFALLRYNAGESRADSWLRLAVASPPPTGVSMESHYLSQVDFPKTRAYARRILKRSRSRNYLF